MQTLNVVCKSATESILAIFKTSEVSQSSSSNLILCYVG